MHKTEELPYYKIPRLERELAEARAWADTMLRKIEVLEAQNAALAARHEKALIEGAARLAERDEARAQIAAIEATDRRLIEENVRLGAALREIAEFTSPLHEAGEIARRALAAPARETSNE
jgi:hypothetical protein